MATFRFEELIVWQRAVDLADLVYEMTSSFPQSEQFGLTNQMRRAAVSVSSNIAEGDARTTAKDRSRFLEIAYGSLMEIVRNRRSPFVVDISMSSNAPSCVSLPTKLREC